MAGVQSQPYDSSTQKAKSVQSILRGSSDGIIPAIVLSQPYGTSTYKALGIQSIYRGSSDLVINKKTQSFARDTADQSKLAGIDGSQFEDRTIPADRFILDSLTQQEIAPDAFDTSEIADGSVTPAKLDRAYQLAISTLSFEAQEFRDITGVGVTSPVEVNDEDAASFPDGSTTGVRVAFEIPDNYDGVGNVEVFLRLSPSTSLTGNFRIDVDHRRNGGALVGAVQATVTPSATANTQTLVGPVLTLGPAGIAAGDGLALLVSRLGADGADSHTGAMRLFSILAKIAS